MAERPTREQALARAAWYATAAGEALPAQARATPQMAATASAHAATAQAWAAIADVLADDEGLEVLVDVTDTVELRRGEGPLGRRLRQVRDREETGRG